MRCWAWVVSWGAAAGAAAARGQRRRGGGGAGWGHWKAAARSWRHATPAPVPAIALLPARRGAQLRAPHSALIFFSSNFDPASRQQNWPWRSGARVAGTAAAPAATSPRPGAPAATSPPFGRPPPWPPALPTSTIASKELMSLTGPESPPYRSFFITVPSATVSNLLVLLDKPCALAPPIAFIDLLEAYLRSIFQAQSLKWAKGVSFREQDETRVHCAVDVALDTLGVPFHSSQSAKKSAYHGGAYAGMVASPRAHDGATKCVYVDVYIEGKLHHMREADHVLPTRTVSNDGSRNVDMIIGEAKFHSFSSSRNKELLRTLCHTDVEFLSFFESLDLDLDQYNDYLNNLAVGGSRSLVHWVALIDKKQASKWAQTTLYVKCRGSDADACLELLSRLKSSKTCDFATWCDTASNIGTATPAADAAAAPERLATETADNEENTVEEDLEATPAAKRSRPELSPVP